MHGQAKAIVLSGICLLLFLPVVEAGSREKALAVISNGGVKVGLQPELGGRIVLLEYNGGRNLIPRSPTPWSWRPTGWPRPPLNYSWTQDFGAVVWTGPQDSWWITQKQARQPYNAGWPPDPDWTLAAFRVLEKSRNRIVLQSPVSRLNGLQLTKTVECLPNGKVRITAQVRNRGNRPVTRDIWFVFRAPFECEEFVPVARPSDVRLLKPGGSRFLNGMHTLQKPKENGKAAFNKAFIVPASGPIAIDFPKGFLLLRFEAAARSRVSKGHAPIEIYRLKNTDGSTLLELEQHSEAKRLRPGQSISATQYWEFLPCAGQRNAEARSRFLTRLFGSVHRCAF